MFQIQPPEYTRAVILEIYELQARFNNCPADYGRNTMPWPFGPDDRSILSVQ
jgi:hypothetical protein